MRAVPGRVEDGETSTLALSLQGEGAGILRCDQNDKAAGPFDKLRASKWRAVRGIPRPLPDPQPSPGRRGESCPEGMACHAPTSSRWERGLPARVRET